MFIDSDKLKDLDFSSKEGRARSRKELEKLFVDGSERDKAAARVLDKLLGLMDEIPDQYSLVHEVAQECRAIEKKLDKRGKELLKLARELGNHGQPVHRFGQVDAYLTVAGGALTAAAEILGKLENYVANEAMEKAMDEEGPLGREAPTEPPPAPDPPPMTPEAPLG